MKRLFSIALLMLLLTNMLTLAFNIQSAKASGTIYIRSDGSIDPLTAPIQRVGDVYTFTDNIYDSIVVERNNIVIDGAGHMVQGSGSGVGLTLLKYVNNVTIESANIVEFGVGVYLYYSCLNTILKNTFASCGVGIILSSSSNNIICGNKMTNHSHSGISLNCWSHHNTISMNTITGSMYEGIGVTQSNDNTIYGNNITNNFMGFNIGTSSFNILKNNCLIGNRYGFRVVSTELLGYFHDIDTSNTVDGKPIYYFVNKHDLVVNSSCPNPGYLALVNSTNINVEGLRLENNWNGVLFAYSTNSQLINCSIRNNRYGIRIYFSSNNVISRNDITDNDLGIFAHNSNSNSFVENNMTKNLVGMFLYYSSNCTLRTNNMVDNYMPIYLRGSELPHYTHNIDTSNIVNEKPVYYWVGFQDIPIPMDAGYVGLVSCRNIIVQGLELKNSSVLLAYTTSSTVADNKMTNSAVDLQRSFHNTIFRNNVTVIGALESDYNNISGNSMNNGCVTLTSSSFNIISNNDIRNSSWEGLWIDKSHNNVVYENNILNNNVGLYLYGSSNNKFFHNNFINNAQQVYQQVYIGLCGYANAWDDDYPSGGNYWSDYTDVDLYSGSYQNETGSDDIWDHPYVIDANNQDHYPLVNPWTTPLHKFRTGDWVRTTANLNVREGPGLSYTIIDTVPEGTLGQIVGGPVEADGYVWWDVDYVVGVRGWSAENWLELASPNQPPVADFTFYPQHPKAGEEVTFDASSSYDLDGEVVFYEWDWNGDGDFDDHTASPTITFWWLEEGTYNIKLRVIDDKGAVCITSKEITVSKSATSETMIILASILDYPRFGWDTTRALNQIDRYMGLDWIKPYDKADLAYILDKEVDPDQAPNLNYKTFVRSKIFEEELIHEAFRFYISVSHQVSKHIFKYVLDSVWKLGVQITLDGIMMLHPLVGAGLKTIYLGVQMYSLSEAFKRINQYWYYLGLAEYWFWRPDSSPEEAWSESVSKRVNKAITTREVPLAEGQKIKTLEETKFYFEELWREYGDKGDFGVGLHEKFRRDNREQLQNLTLSKLRETFGARELPDRTIVHVGSPVELRVYDSEGRITGVVDEEEKTEIPNSVYDSETKTTTIFLPSDSLRYEVVGTGAGTYALEITSMENGQIINFTATDIPTSPNTIHEYTVDWSALSLGEEGVTVSVDSDGDGVFEHTFTSGSVLNYDAFMLQTATTVDFDPDTLNMGSKGKWVTVYIKLPEGYDVADINVSSILLNSTIPVDPYAPWAIGDYDEDGIPDLMVKFDRAQVTEHILANVNLTKLYEERFMTITLTITGRLNDGTPFQASTTIRIIMPMPSGSRQIFSI